MSFLMSPIFVTFTFSESHPPVTRTDPFLTPPLSLLSYCPVLQCIRPPRFILPQSSYNLPETQNKSPKTRLNPEVTEYKISLERHVSYLCPVVPTSFRWSTFCWCCCLPSPVRQTPVPRPSGLKRLHFILVLSYYLFTYVPSRNYPYTYS